MQVKVKLNELELKRLQNELKYEVSPAERSKKKNRIIVLKNEINRMTGSNLDLHEK